MKQRLGPLWWHGALSFAVDRGSDILNLYTGLFLVPALIPVADWGAIVPILRLMGFVSFPLVVLFAAAPKYLNRFHVAGERGKIKGLLGDMLAAAVVYSALAALFLWVFRDSVQQRLKFEDRRIVWAIAGLLLVGHCHLVVQMATQGVMKFYRLIASNFLMPATRLVFMIILLVYAQLLGYLTAMFAANVVTALYLAWGVRGYFSRSTARESYREHASGMFRYMRSITLVQMAFAASLFVEAWAVRNFTPKADSAGFYIANTFGQIPLCLSGAVGPFLFPLVSERFERRDPTSRLLVEAMLVVLVAGGALSVLLGVTGGWILGLRDAWKDVRDYAPAVWQMGIVNTFHAALVVYMTHENACSRFRYSRFFVTVLILESVLLYCLLGWHFFRPYLPDLVWGAVEARVTRRLGFVLWFMLAARGVLLIYSLAHMAAMSANDSVGRRDPAAKPA